ncbi:MAG TPA: hypothetical protein PK299_15285 [Anaerolineales bacterium]|nr:hypothetical protein [Anaerolineales bacterium]
MNSLLQQKLTRAFQLTYDLFAHLAEADLCLALADLPANRIAAQVWCVVGARESYLKAIQHGEWQGFACSLRTPKVQSAVLAALEASAEQLSEIAFNHLNEKQLSLAFDLLEHEVQHHGQLVRYVYANQLTFPTSWQKRYALS